MASINRTHQYVVFLDDLEDARLKAMAKEDGTPASIIVRALLRREWAKRHGSENPKAKAKR